MRGGAGGGEESVASELGGAEPEKGGDGELVCG